MLPDLRLRTTAGSTFYKRRRARGGPQGDAQGDVQGVVDKLEVNEEKRIAEEEGHHNVLQRLKGKGQELLHKLESTTPWSSYSKKPAESSRSGTMQGPRLRYCLDQQPGWLLYHGRLSYLCRQWQSYN